MFVANHPEGFLKGRVQAEELRGQFGERLPGAYQAAARAMGVTTEELAKMSEDGELLAEDLLPPLAKELMRMANSGGQLEKAMNNTNSALNRFSNNVLLANMRFQEAGMDKGIRDLANSASDFVNRADELWTLMGKIGPALFFPFRALFEIFGALSDKFGEFTDKVEVNESTIKVFSALVASLFGWSRKLLFAFILIPAAVSNMAKAIDGEQLTWTQWATTLAGIAASLFAIRRASKGVGKIFGKGPLKGSPAAAGTGSFIGGIMGAGALKVSVVSFLGLSAFGAIASLLHDTFFGEGPSARTGAQFEDKFGENLRLPRGEDGGPLIDLPRKIRDLLQTPASEIGFLNRRADEFNLRTPEMLSRGVEGFGNFLNREAVQQNNTVTIEINGAQEPEKIAWTIDQHLNRMVREAGINDPSQEK